MGQAVYLCLEDGWRSGVVTECFCNATSSDEINLSAGSQTVCAQADFSVLYASTADSDAAKLSGSATAMEIPTADVEYAVRLDGYPKATTPVQSSTIRVPWLWLRQGCSTLSSDEAQKLVGCSVRKRFPGHGVFKGTVIKVKFVHDAGAQDTPAVQCTTADGVTKDIWFNIRYEDGDKEDVAFHELIGMITDARVEAAKGQQDVATVAPASTAAALPAEVPVAPAAGADRVQHEPAADASGSTQSSEQQEQGREQNDNAADAVPKKDNSHERETLARPVFPGLQTLSSLGVGKLQEEEEQMQLHLLQSKPQRVQSHCFNTLLSRERKHTHREREREREREAESL